MGANAFFASAEVALLSARRSRLRQLSGEGNVGAQAALSLLANPERLRSVIQVGVTLASLGLGWAGASTIFDLLLREFHPALTPAGATALHGAAFVLSFLILTFAHVVIGEVVPKNLAAEKADRLAVTIAPVLLVFYRVSQPFVYVLEKASAAISRWMGLRGETYAGGHSKEDLRAIVSSSRISGHLPAQQEDMINRALDLDNLYVREIMVPRNEIISVPAEATLDQVLATMIEHQHSRLPVYDGRPEQIVGLLHYKDLLPIWQARRRPNPATRLTGEFRVSRLMRKLLVVPETKPLIQMLAEFRTGRSHMAVVVDEFGTIVGLLTVEDVLEQLVGEIEDEYDESTRLPPLPADAIIELEGATPIRDLETQYGIEIPTDAGFETLAGFVLFKLGRIPDTGVNVEYGERRFTVLSMERNRIAKVRIEKM